MTIDRDMTDPQYLRSIGVADADIAPTIANEITARQRDAEARRNEDVQLALAAQEAVGAGEATWQQAAAALHAAGRHDAHDAVLQMWREDEAYYRAEDIAGEEAFYDVNEYAQHFAEQQARELRQIEQNAQEIALQLEQAKLQQLIDKFEQFKKETPGAHNIAPAVERRLVNKIHESGEIPVSEADATAAIETALIESSVLGDAQESLKEQVNVEWRLHRKNSGARDGLMTVADIGRAEEAFKSARLQQLADSKMIDLESLKPGPTAEEQSQAITDRYREKNAKSTSLHQTVADIAKRGAEANAARDRGIGISEEKKAYKEAYARAEENAAYGEVRTAVGTEEAPAKSGGYGPDGSWPDELGPAI